MDAFGPFNQCASPVVSSLSDTIDRREHNEELMPPKYSQGALQEHQVFIIRLLPIIPGTMTTVVVNPTYLKYASITI